MKFHSGSAVIDDFYRVNVQPVKGQQLGAHGRSGFAPIGTRGDDVTLKAVTVYVGPELQMGLAGVLGYVKPRCVFGKEGYIIWTPPSELAGRDDLM